jgi:hypothetical protein
MPDKKDKPKQKDLIEHRVLQDLEDAAEKYRDVRDQRMALTPRENELKLELLALMKKHKRTVYERDGIHIEVIATEETVKVKIDKPEEAEGERVEV